MKEVLVATIPHEPHSLCDLKTGYETIKKCVCCFRTNNNNTNANNLRIVKSNPMLGCEETRCKRCDDCRTRVSCDVILCSDVMRLNASIVIFFHLVKSVTYWYAQHAEANLRHHVTIAIKMIFIAIIVLMVNSVPNANHTIVLGVLVNI